MNPDSDIYSYCLNNPLKYTDPSGNNYKPIYWDEAIGGGSGPSYGWDNEGGNGFWHRGDYYIPNGNGSYTGSIYGFNLGGFGGLPYYDKKAGSYRTWIGSMGYYQRLIAYTQILNNGVDFPADDGPLIFQDTYWKYIPSTGGSSFGGSDAFNTNDKRFTYHISTETRLPGMPNIKVVSTTTLGKGPFHLRSVNASNLNYISYSQHGPITHEIYYQDGGQSLSISLGKYYLSGNINEQYFGFGFGIENGNISVGYECEMPKIFLDLLLLPMKVESPSVSPVPIRIPIVW